MSFIWSKHFRSKEVSPEVIYIPEIEIPTFVEEPVPEPPAPEPLPEPVPEPPAPEPVPEPVPEPPAPEPETPAEVVVPELETAEQTEE